MGRDGMMWGADDDTMTLEEYRKNRQSVEEKKSDFIEATTANLDREENTNV
jgi:hypothetical protein